MNKHLEKAERLLQKGKIEAALEEFLIARHEEPGNDSIVLIVADLYQRLNKPRECRQCYAYLFDKYVEKGDSSQTLEFLRNLQKMGPVEPKRLVACAQVVEKQKPEDAREFYRQALEALGGQDPEMSLQCLQGLAASQPSSLEIQQQIAALASKVGKKALAASAYNKMAEVLTAERKYAEAADALERAYSLSVESAPAKLILAKACAKASRFPRVLELLAKDAEESNNPQELILVAEAYLAGTQLPKAEAVYWKLAKSFPDAIERLIEIALDYIRQDNLLLALPLLKKLDQHLSAEKDQKGLISLAEKLSRVAHTTIPALEFLSQLADRLHLDGPLEKSLNGLFDLYFAAGEFHKATDVLERLIDVDPYDPRSFGKLDKLEGKASPAIWKELATRLGRTSTVSDASSGLGSSADAAAPAAESPTESSSGSVLGDLILQAEIFLQYKLQDKALDRLQRIVKLFPGEEEKNDELRALFEKARFNPQTAVPAAVPAAVPRPAAPLRTGEIQADWSRISEISRNLSRQGTVNGVLSAAVNDIGRLWQASRCIIGLAASKRPPSMVLEYLSPGVPRSDAPLLGKLVMGLQEILEERASALFAEKVSEDRPLAPLKDLLAALHVQSLVAIPLRENDQPAGILLLEQCGSSRVWKSNDLAALETLAEQIVFAVSNARLRSLMKTLAVTDERSGLLHRDSYLTCLFSEVERMRQQKKPLAAAILQFSSGKQQQEKDEALEEFMQQFGSSFASHLRQSDIPLKYGSHSLVAIMPGTVGKEAVLMIEKMRKLAAALSLSSASGPPPMSAGVAEAVREEEMDSADIVTELINRVEYALEEAQANGGNSTKILDPPTLPQ